MKKILKLTVIAAVLASMTSCSIALPGLVTRNSVGTKVGTAERKIFLGLAFGHTDLSLTKAAKNGGITKIATVDYKVTGGLFSKTYATIVTGE